MGRAWPKVSGWLLWVLLLAGASGVRAHEVPAEVQLDLWVAAEGTDLEVLVRAPLEAFRDLTLPLRDGVHLDLEALDAPLRDGVGLWIADYLEVYADGTVLSAPRLDRYRVSLPSDDSFADLARARAHLSAAPLPSTTDLAWDAALVDVALHYRLPREDAALSLEPQLAHLGIETHTRLRYRTPDGATRLFTYVGDPGLLPLDPGLLDAITRFVRSGVVHILAGTDHLLFLLCLILPVRRLRPLVAIVTAFTVAHSITLIAAALGAVPRALWFPPFVETLIAASIVWMALENILDVRVARRWQTAFAFGLVHGFGFAFVLGDDLQFAGGHVLTALLGFNLGVEVGQIAVLLVAVPVLRWAFSRLPVRPAAIVLSALVAHTAWHWMTDRGADFLAYPIAWPSPDLALLQIAMQFALIGCIAIAAAWGLSVAYGRWLPDLDTRMAAQSDNDPPVPMARA
ncbi:MAG: HupE/UreJ family protein [Pseudomonadales bacterium]|jgi:hypothetical protein|nr:HupE/UreJ family protein [Pseudomonadales bacterium]